MRRVLRVLALAAATSAERPDSCAFKLVPIRDSEQSYYWPGGDDLCHVLARNSSAAQRCGKGETPAWDKTAFDVHHLCMRMASGPPHIHYMHERPNLYTRLRRLPPGNHSEWRNRVAEAIGRLFPDVPIAPMGDLTEDMWDMHPHSKDCTHWCYAPALVEAVAYLILHVVEAVDEGKGRHELDWALHARHRG